MSSNGSIQVLQPGDLPGGWRARYATVKGELLDVEVRGWCYDDEDKEVWPLVRGNRGLLTRADALDDETAVFVDVVVAGAEDRSAEDVVAELWAPAAARRDGSDAVLSRVADEWYPDVVQAVLHTLRWRGLLAA